MTVVVERDLIELAERCEKATGPDRELDRDIIFAVYPKDRVAIFDGVKHISTMTGRDGEAWFNPLADRDDCPHYTGSLDDAESLMPDNTGVIQYWILGKKPIVSLQRDGWDFQLSAETKILALCAASLRARASLKGEANG